MMKKLKIEEFVLDNFSVLLKEQFGFYYPKEKYKDLERGIINLMSDLNESNPEYLFQRLKAPLSKEKIEILTSQFTVGETYFFRESAYFDVLKARILPKIIHCRKNTHRLIRIWSAGCASGEEPYSIAILVSELIKDLDNWNITILATDINLNSLHKLKAGIYSEWSFRNVSSEIKEKYFNKIDKCRYEIKPLYKKMVNANYLNLAQDVYPSLINNTNAMDIIFCRNVLMYFEANTINKILKNLENSLIEGGYLVVGSSEHSLVPSDLYFEEKLQNTVFYVKDEHVLLNNKSNLVKNQMMDLEEYESIHKDNIESAFLSCKNFSEINDRDFSNMEMDLNERVYIEHKKNEKSTQEKKNINEVLSSNESDLDIEAQSRMLANQGKLNESLALIEKGIQNDKCNSILRYLKGLVLQELGFLQEAVAEFNKTIYIDPNFILAYFSLGNIAAIQSQVNMAKKYYSIVLSLTEQYLPTDELPGSEGSLTVERMREIIHSKKLIS